MTNANPKINISPGVSILGVLSHLNYEPWYALAEYVDNAIQSYHADQAALLKSDKDYALVVNIDIDPDGPGRIVIEDNAGGIHRDQFERAFRAAEVPPDRTGLSEFGMGMKSASIWFAKQWTVETTSIGDDNIYRIAFDMQAVLEGRISELDVTTVDTDSDTHFTRITMWDLNQAPRGRTLGKIRDHVRDIYRSFLRTGELRLVISGERMSFREPTVLNAVDAREDSTTGTKKLWTKPIEIVLSESVRVTGFAALREEGSTKEAGFALLRRGRVIIGSGDAPYRPVPIYGRGNSYRSQRLYGELIVEGLPVSHTKDGFQWGDHEEEFLERLREELDSEPIPLLRQAENYRSRALSRQQSKLIVDATDNTARAAERGLPKALASLRPESVKPTELPTEESEEAKSLETALAQPGSVDRLVEFQLEGQSWQVTVSAGPAPLPSAWLTRHFVRESASAVKVGIALNSSHDFVRQFALGDKDSFEAVLRIAVALVVAESLTRDAGQTFTGEMFRNIDTVLTQGLSDRIGK
ncbi:ATP-binding protein (plasmid) [Rathayibacter festucae]|uniref:ATP-binding protein n=1 Tax=Rathayibacter festucae TaxID=110937 RepID=A0ABX6H5J0_9MICO|nr:ATP-binding protein [Rathayibacter festucae]QHC65070.1 ATP-binding protein [Rathayibacter festucae]